MSTPRVVEAVPARSMMTAIAVSASLLCCIAGCEASTPQEEVGIASPTARPAETVTPSDIPTAVPSTLADRVTPAPTIRHTDAASLTSSPWTLVAISANRRMITIKANQGGGCDHPGGVEVTQTSTHVEIASLYQSGNQTPGTNCLAYLATPIWALTLTRPLGTRTLIHAPATGNAP